MATTALSSSSSSPAEAAATAATTTLTTSSNSNNNNHNCNSNSNSRIAVTKRRGVGKRLTDKERITILELLESGHKSASELAREYAVTRQAIHKLKTHKHEIFERYTSTCEDGAKKENRRRGQRQSHHLRTTISPLVAVTAPLKRSATNTSGGTINTNSANTAPLVSLRSLSVLLKPRSEDTRSDDDNDNDDEQQQDMKETKSPAPKQQEQSSSDSQPTSPVHQNDQETIVKVEPVHSSSPSCGDTKPKETNAAHATSSGQSDSNNSSNKDQETASEEEDNDSDIEEDNDSHVHDAAAKVSPDASLLRSVWFFLVNAKDEMLGCDKLQLPCSRDVADFKTAVKAKNPNKLLCVDASDLQVFKTQDSLNQKRLRLEEDTVIGNSLGCTKQTALIVVVPDASSQTGSAMTITSPKMTTTIVTETIPKETPIEYQPNPLRLKRWHDLQRILSKRKKRRHNTEGEAVIDASITWKEVRRVFEKSFTSYEEQQAVSVNDSSLDILMKYLETITRAFGSIVTGQEAKRLHFIAPMVACASDIFDGNVSIHMDESFDGHFVDTKVRFDFVLECANKRICVIEAKNDDVEQAMTQALLGCEIVAEHEQLDCVYGIVTNYLQWVFLKSLPSGIHQHVASLALDGFQSPTRESVAIITGKIHAMLSE